MPGTAITQAGNYALRVDTGYDVGSFTLDSAIKGVLAGYTTTTTRTNLLTNPNFETNTTGWQALGTGTTITRITTDAYVGSACLQVSTGTVANSAAITLSSPASSRTPVTAGQPYYLSAYVKVPTGQPSGSLRLRTLEFRADGTQNASQISSAVVVSDTDGWVRLSYADTPTAGATPTVTMSFRVEAPTTVARTYLVDAVLFEQSATLLPYFDGTYAEPYTGYTLTNQQWNGTANASTSTATWGLTSTYIGSNYPLGPTTDFADITASATQINVRRGRRDQGDQFAAGTMSFTINDTDGVFNPFDENSPYYNTPEALPGLAPLRAVELIRYDDNDNPEYLYRGRIVNYEYNFSLDGLDQVIVYCADNFYLLSQTYMNELNVDVETSGQRIETVLDLPEVDYPTGAARNIDVGTVDLGHDAAYTVPAGTNVLSYLTQINQTAEFGRLFVSRAGVLTFTPRVGTTLSGSVADFHDDGTAIPYDGLGITFEADQVVNRVLIENLGTAIATAEDLPSQAAFFIQTNSITNSLLDDSELSAAATYLLDPTPEARYNSVETMFGALTAAQRDTVAVIDINDTISIEKTFVTGSSTMTLAQELSVEGVEHTITLNGHRVALFTSPTTIVYELILDDAQYGTIDTTNVLG